jgi:hypothetical protein
LVNPVVGEEDRVRPDREVAEGEKLLVHRGVNRPTNLECLPGRGIISSYPKKPEEEYA